MIDFTRADTKATKIIYALVIIIFAIGLPAYFLLRGSWENFEPSVMAFVGPILYLAVVVGFVFGVFNIDGGLVTKKETDEKIISAFSKIFTPIYWVLLVSLLCASAYWAWQIWG